MLCFGCQQKPPATVSGAPLELTSADLSADSKGMSKARAIIRTVHGNIEFKFYPNGAPHTTTRIVQLIQKGFYDGLTFHRIIPNYIIQSGDPTGTGNGGSGSKLKAEFNSLQHVRGSVGMARPANDIDGADSQFYITLSTQPQLDGKYTIFGQVIEGMEVLDKVTPGDKIISMSISNE